MLSKKDQYLGSGGPILLPEQKGSHPHLAIVGGKDGNLFVVDRDHMGQYHAGSDDVVQTVKLKGALHAAPAYWDQNVYVFGDGDVLQQLAVRDGTLEPAHSGNFPPVPPWPPVPLPPFRPISIETGSSGQSAPGPGKLSPRVWQYFMPTMRPMFPA